MKKIFISILVVLLFSVTYACWTDRDHRTYGICGDLDWSGEPLEEGDFLLVVENVGRYGILIQGIDKYFSKNDHVDLFDIFSWGWMMNSYVQLLNACDDMSLLPDENTMEGEYDVSFFEANLNPTQEPLCCSSMIVIGKTNSLDCQEKMKEKLYYISSGIEDDVPVSYCNTRLLEDTHGNLHVVNSMLGLMKISGGVATVIGPNVMTFNPEPKYNRDANVYIGIQSEGDKIFGRPLLDASFDFTETDCNVICSIYIVPVVVNPTGAPPYEAAAKLTFDAMSPSPCWQISKLYAPDDNDDLREIDNDILGNVYASGTNTIYKFARAGNKIKFALPENMKAPVGFCVSPGGLYFSPSSCDSVIIYCLSINYGLPTETFEISRTINISNMNYVTDTINNGYGGIEAVGFKFNQYLSEYPNCYDEPPPYDPYIAYIPHDQNNVVAVPIQGYNLGLPISATYLHPNGMHFRYTDVDTNLDGVVNFIDYNTLSYLSLEDLQMFFDYWLYGD